MYRFRPEESKSDAIEIIRYGGKVSLRQATMTLEGASLRLTLLAIGAFAPPKLRFGPEKLIDSTLFTAGGN